MLRVGYVQTEFPSLTESFVTTELTLLERRGVTVVPFSVTAPTFPDVLDAEARAWLPRVRRPAARDVLALSPAAVNSALPTVTRRSERTAVTLGGWLGLPFAAAIAETMRREDLTHLHTHFAGGSAHLAQIAGRIAGRPFSVTAHAYDVYSVAESAWPTLRERLEAAAFVRASHASLAERLRQIAPKATVHVLPTPLDLDDPRLAWRAPRDDIDVLQLVTVARLVPKKGLDLLAPLIAALAERGVRAHCTVVGPGDPRGVGAVGVTCLGPRSREETLARVRSADVMVLPCRVTSDGDRDGVPYALLEAMAIGLPCVSTAVAGLPELFDGALAPWLAPPDDLVALADRVAQLATEATTRAEASDTGRARVEERYGAGRIAELIALF